MKLRGEAVNPDWSIQGTSGRTGCLGCILRKDVVPKILLRVGAGEYERPVILALGRVCKIHRGDRKVPFRELLEALCDFISTYLHQIISVGALWLSF